MPCLSASRVRQWQRTNGAKVLRRQSSAKSTPFFKPSFAAEERKRKASIAARKAAEQSKLRPALAQLGVEVDQARAQEMLARVAGTAGWKDPHTRHGPGTQGRYTLLGAEPAASDGTPGAISSTRSISASALAP